jgi:inhibitor of cysteine peptidase
MRKVFYFGIVGILLSLLAISPVIAATSVQSSAGTPLSPASYFSYAVQVHPVQGRFVSSSALFTPVSPATSYSRFASYTKTGTGSTRTFTESDNGKSITLNKGQVIKVQLNENPTTGYRWEPTVSSGIQITGDTYVASASGRMGAGGIHTWTLKITGTGDQHFNAEYKRSWESGSADNYSLQFVVS